MSNELETLSTKLERTLSVATGVALTKEQVKEVAESLLEDGYRLTEPTGPFIAERSDGLARRTEDFDRASEFAGANGHVLQRRQVVTPFEQVD
jgi:hypothetical protein